MEWYLKVLRQYADFNGRARRKEYWMFILFHYLIMMGSMFFDGLFSAVVSDFGIPIFMTLFMIYYVGTIIPQLAVTVRRLHDTGRSGWTMLLGLIPLIGGIWLLVLYCTEGDKHANEYGPDPKADNVSDLIDEIGERDN